MTKLHLLADAVRKCVPVACLTLAVAAAAAAQSAPSDASEIRQLKQELADQQRQISELRSALQELRSVIASGPRPTAPTPAPIVAATPSQTPPAPEAADAPLQIHLGRATLQPLGFMDFTSVFRSTGTGNSIGTNFGSVPYGNTPAGHLREFRTSAQNSRVGLRVDTKVAGADILGYLETDFLGFLPPNTGVTTNSDSLRMRLYWVDVRKSKLEVLGGQSWSMMTPGRSGLSALPSNVFYGQLADVNYQTGLIWSRNPQFRLIVHPSDSLAMGVSFEQPEQYIGGSGGGGVVTLPAALAAPYATQLDNGATTLNVPNAHPDIVGKIAYDKTTGQLHQHVEVAGLFRTFRVFNPASGSVFTSHGYGGSLNVNLEIAKNLHLLSNNFLSDGGGRYIFGLAPDLIVRPDGSLSPVHAASTVQGLEYQYKKWQVAGYWGGVYISKSAALDAGNRWIGYGYPGSGGGHNRVIQEPSFAVTRTFWNDPKFGSLQTIFQYSYVSRAPWSVTPGQPDGAHTHMVFADLRYNLPGKAPK